MNVMNKINQILLIKEFLNSNDKNIIVNQVNDELGLFYLSVIKYYAEKKGVNINIDNSAENIGVEEDLFGQRAIEILSITNTTKLNTTLDASYKKIIFTDYKNYKKLNTKYICINGYKFEIDISFFIKNELNINNDQLLYFSKNNPALIFSETSKYLINKNQYTSDQAIVEEKNNILSIRKLIFEIKKNNLNIKNLYFNLKKEAEYKKLSFLIY